MENYDNQKKEGKALSIFSVPSPADFSLVFSRNILTR
jgi:hypothetical protein